jgi:hypothetical protein
MASGRGKAVLIIAAAAIIVVGGTMLAVFGFGWGRRTAGVTGETGEDRLRSVGRLGTLKPAESAKALAAATEDADPAVRQAALVGLARSPTADARAAIDRGTRDPSAKVRAAAASTLGRYLDEAAADRLGEMILRDPEPEVRIGAALGLGRHASPKALVWLMEAAEKDTSLDVMTAALTQIYFKLGMRFIGMRGQTGDEAVTSIRRIVENLKDDVNVEAAYRKAGRSVVRNPAYYVPPLGEPDPRERRR